MANLEITDSDREAAKITPALRPTSELPPHHATQLQRKIDLHVLPMLFLVYVMAFLDR
jgi:hypothetical protein